MNISESDIKTILNGLHDVVRDKCSDENNRIKIKIFPGLSITSEFIPINEFNENLRKNIKSDNVLRMSANITAEFKKSIKHRYYSK